MFKELYLKSIKLAGHKRSKVFFFPEGIEKKESWLLNPSESLTQFFNQLDLIEFNE